uniref:Fibronectin leucine rich transmembrane protein 2 n=1 Tax=Cyprinus carpio TaxID=7962 RepID=A0A8C2HNA7_CYPCA
MEFQAGFRNNDWTSFLRFWLTVLLSLHVQFSPVSSCPKECRCDRTFVYCNERSLTSVPLGVQEGYKTLFLHNNQINNAGFPLELHNVASVDTVYLYGNQLDEFPLNLPRNVRVLHLQENNIQTISRAALAQLSMLEELHLDDNSISTVGVEEGAFREAVSLKLLFLTKNHLSSIPIGLPADLKELRLDENRIADIDEDAFQNVTSLQRLLLEGNLLEDDAIAPGTFQDLVKNLRHLIARNNLWRCDCNIKWVIAWLRSLPSAINVRGFTCQSPERVRGMVIRDLTLDAIDCPAGTVLHPWPTHSYPSTMPPPNPTPPFPHFPPGPLPPYEDPLKISFHIVNSTCIDVSWESYFTVTAYKVTWVKMGQSLMSDITRERTVPGSQRRLSLSNLEPRSIYRICVYVLDTLNTYRPGEDTICSEAKTKSTSTYSESEQAAQQDNTSTLLLAGVIGGAVLVVLVTLLSLFCWHMHKKSRSSSSKWKYNRGRRKDDYCEAGTKKDNSILEMTETNFQIVSLNNEQLLKGDFRIQPIYTPNGGIGLRDCHLSNNSIAYCKSSNVPSVDFCHT